VKRFDLAALLLVTVVTFATITAGAAQQPPAGRAGAPAPGPGGPGGPGGGRGGPAAVPPMLDYATARKAMAAAEAAATSASANVTIAIVDANGDLAMLNRLEGSRGVAVTSAEGKARAAILFGMPTGQIQEAMAANQPVSARVTLPPLGGFEITPVRGGVPIIRDGKVIGAVGVGGAAAAVDEQIAQAGVNAVK
jgi:glc operon protein GlcG